jgi:hypothetical protein
MPQIMGNRILGAEVFVFTESLHYFVFNQNTDIITEVLPHCYYLAVVFSLLKLLDVGNFILADVPPDFHVVKYQSFKFHGIVKT